MVYNYITHKHEVIIHQNVVNNWKNLKAQSDILKRHLSIKNEAAVKNWYFQMKGDLKSKGQKPKSNAMRALNNFYSNYKNNPELGNQYFNDFTLRVSKMNTRLSR